MTKVHLPIFKGRLCGFDPLSFYAQASLHRPDLLHLNPESSIPSLIVDDYQSQQSVLKRQIDWFERSSCEPSELKIHPSVITSSQKKDIRKEIFGDDSIHKGMIHPYDKQKFDLQSDDQTEDKKQTLLSAHIDKFTSEYQRNLDQAKKEMRGGNYREAQRYYLKALISLIDEFKIKSLTYEELILFKEKEADCHFKIGLCFTYIGELEIGFKYIDKAIETYQSLDSHHPSLIRIFHEKALCYEVWELEKVSKPVYQKVVDIFLYQIKHREPLDVDLYEFAFLSMIRVAEISLKENQYEFNDINNIIGKWGNIISEDPQVSLGIRARIFMIMGLHERMALNQEESDEGIDLLESGLEQIIGIQETDIDLHLIGLAKLYLAEFYLKTDRLEDAHEMLNHEDILFYEDSVLKARLLITLAETKAHPKAENEKTETIFVLLKSAEQLLKESIHPPDPGLKKRMDQLWLDITLRYVASVEKLSSNLNNTDN